MRTRSAPAYFDSREDAARQLAGALGQYRGRNPLVLAIPRGAVGMGAVIAEALGGELDVVLVRKLRSPHNPELAIGAIDESGWVHLERHALDHRIDAVYLEREKAEQLALLRRRRALYTGAREPCAPENRIVIVIDDGLATGASMTAALHAVRAKRPRKLVCAVPVAAPDSLERVGRHADEVVCLSAPEEFYAVGQFYRVFNQVGDDEVIATLQRLSEAAKKR